MIVKYVRGRERKDTLFGDALGGLDNNLYHIHKNLRLEGQAYAMTVDNFWRLCYDAHVKTLYIYKSVKNSVNFDLKSWTINKNIKKPISCIL